MYNVTLHRADQLVKFTLRGSIEEDEMRTMLRDFDGLAAGNREVRGVLADLSDCTLASAEVTSLFGDLEERTTGADGRRLAILVPNPLVANQLNRVAEQQGKAQVLRRFVDEAAARAWLGQ